MSKFKKKKTGDLPAISTASLPDIVFMLLFFFMVATVMRDSTLMVKKYSTSSRSDTETRQKRPSNVHICREAL